MQELNQGEDYEEEDYGFEDEDGEFDEGDESTESEITTIYGIPKNIFIIGVIAIIVIIIAIVIIATRSSSDEAEEDFDYEEYLESLNYSTAVDYEETEDTEYVEDTTTSAEEVLFYDINGNSVGYYYTEDNVTFYIYDMNYESIGDSTVGNSLIAYDANGNQLFTYDLFSDVNSTVDFDEVNVELRKLGYTGDEIELALANDVDVEKLKEAAQALRDEEAKESLIRMSDSASPEFQHIVQNSIFCMTESPFPVESYDELTVSEEHSYIVNADYWKVPTYGLQLYIKCKIANGTYVFYLVDPSRWVTLPDEGNIVLNITYRLYGNESLVNCYVENIQEVDTTELTVNPQDSGVNLQDVVNDAFLNR